MISVLVVGDTRLYRDGLAHALAAHAAIHVAGTACHAEDAIVCARALGPDIVLLDMAMPRSLPLVRALAGPPPLSSVVALALSESDAELVACAEAGVAGFLGRDASVEELAEMLESVSRGELPCTPRVAALLRQRLTALAAGRRVADAGARLTGRERDILRLIDRGLPNKEIARSLGIEVATVKNHVHNILDKLQARTRGEAAARARRAEIERGIGTASRESLA